jgi:uncharacterized protein YacL
MEKAFPTGVLTISDKGSQGKRIDESGKTAVNLLQGAGFPVVQTKIIPDDRQQIVRTLIEWAEKGLEVLHHIQKQVDVDVRIEDRDYPAIKEVDSKLIELAKEVRGKIITNDSNLNKVAELQGIEVLNINELANSLKPVVLPGEEINVKILKEGKEMGQGVAYLDDGTMIVVDNGRRIHL